MARLRIAQMKKRDIAFHFLVNGPIPDDLPVEAHEYTLVKGEMSPHLFWAPKALQTFLQDFYKVAENEKYKYILRVNISTFVNFDRFVWMLNYLPKENLLAGSFLGRYEKFYLSGTVHLFSKNVAKAYAYDTTLNDIECNTLTEDVVTSFALIDRFTSIDLNFFFNWGSDRDIDKIGSGYKTCEESHKILEQNQWHHVFYRVCNVHDRDTVDSYIWEMLFYYFR